MAQGVRAGERPELRRQDLAAPSAPDDDHGQRQEVLHALQAAIAKPTAVRGKSRNHVLKDQWGSKAPLVRERQALSFLRRRDESGEPQADGLTRLGSAPPRAPAARQAHARSEYRAFSSYRGER